MLDFVPLAGAGGQVADEDVEAEFVGQLLQFAFPQPHPRTVAAAAIGGDQQAGGIRVTRPPEVEPPLANAVDREGGRVVVDADTQTSETLGKPVAAGTSSHLTRRWRGQSRANSSLERVCHRLGKIKARFRGVYG